MNINEMRILAQVHAVADGLPVDRGADIEMVLTYHGRCHHVIITEDGDMWVDGWLVATCSIPDVTHSVNQHAELTPEAIKMLHKRFERMKSC